MARRGVPDPLTRRHLVERELSRDQATRIAEAYLDKDRRVEAVAFLAKAQDAERLRALRDAAVREGDAFLLKEVTRALGGRPTPEEWRTLAGAAEAAGKIRYQAEAQRQAERGEG